jgi:hypothetical protein
MDALFEGMHTDVIRGVWPISFFSANSWMARRAGFDIQLMSKRPVTQAGWCVGLTITPARRQ